MRRLTMVALCVAFAGFAAADDKKAGDPAGTWACESDINGQKRASTLTLKRDGDTFAGTMVWLDLTESSLTDVSHGGRSLMFSAVREWEGHKFTVRYTARIEGDTIKGKAAADFEGETRTVGFEAKRAKTKGSGGT